MNAIESGFPDALTVAAQELQRNRAPEVAVATAASRATGPAADVFAEAARLQRTIGLPLEKAFLGTDGALVNYPGPRLHAGAALLARAADEGPNGGQVLLSLAAHLDALVEVERRARRDLSTVVGTLRTTAWCFAPLIGGTTVALAGRLDGATLGRAMGAETALSTGGIATVIGVYVLLLAVVLTALATGLECGADRAMIGYQIGLAVLAATVIYPLAVHGTALFL